MISETITIEFKNLLPGSSAHRKAVQLVRCAVHCVPVELDGLILKPYYADTTRDLSQLGGGHRENISIVCEVLR